MKYRHLSTILLKQIADQNKGSLSNKENAYTHIHLGTLGKYLQTFKQAVESSHKKDNKTLFSAFH